MGKICGMGVETETPKESLLKMNLREQVLKLAHAKPEMREHLLPMIKQAAGGTLKDAVLVGIESYAKKLGSVLSKLVERKHGMRSSRVLIEHPGSQPYVNVRLNWEYKNNTLSIDVAILPEGLITATMESLVYPESPSSGESAQDDEQFLKHFNASSFTADKAAQYIESKLNI